jgi:hypothetical protein
VNKKKGPKGGELRKKTFTSCLDMHVHGFLPLASFFKVLGRVGIAMCLAKEWNE